MSIIVLPSMAFEATIDGLIYNLSGINATVLRVAPGNTNTTIQVPASISYEGLTYTVNEIGTKCFVNIDHHYSSGSSKYCDLYENGQKIDVGGRYDYYVFSYCHITYDAYIYDNMGEKGLAKNNSYVKEVILPNTIQTIGKYAFSNSQITKVQTSSGIQQILEGGFHTPNLTEINLYNTVESIGELAFYYTKLKELVVPASTLTMAQNSFSACSLLRRIVYLGGTPPTNWTATTATYVPNKDGYSSPASSINDAHVIEMISFAKNEFDYTGQRPTTTWTNNVDGYTVSLTMPTLKIDAGTYEEIIPATFTKGDESFTANIVYRYTIKPAQLKAKVNNASREYGEDNPHFSVTYSGFLGGDNESVITTTPTISTTATKTSNVGEYPITISGGSAANYEFVCEPGVLTVSKASLTAKVNDATRVYGTKNPTFSIEYYGLKNGESVPAWVTEPTIQTDATQNSNVGSYTVQAVNGNPLNYNLNGINYGTLRITPASLTIKANDAARQYYSEEPTFSYHCNGFVNGDSESALSSVPTLKTAATLTSNVGTYDIKVGEVYSTNYAITYVNGTLTITPRMLTASVGNYERLYNEENPTFEVKYEGYVGGDNESQLKTKATASTSATKTSDVGIYPIYVSGGSADNYKLSYVSGKLTINKIEQTISWQQDLTGLNVGDQVELKAVASSGLPITYTMDNSDAAEIYSTGSKTYLDCKAGGQFLIRAVQNGNKNYYASPRASNSVSIIGNYPTSDPMLTIKQADSGSVGIQVTKGSSYTFTIAPSNGWKIHSVTFNNSDVTTQLSSDGRYTTPTINSNSTLYVVYEQGNTAVRSVKESTVQIQAESFGVRVIDANMGDMIYIYTTDGLLQHSIKVDAQTIDIPLTKDNVYIVKVGMKTVKLSL